MKDEKKRTDELKQEELEQATGAGMTISSQPTEPREQRAKTSPARDGEVPPRPFDNDVAEREPLEPQVKQ